MAEKPKIKDLKASHVKASLGDYSLKLGTCKSGEGSKKTMELKVSDSKTILVPCWVKKTAPGEPKVAYFESSALGTLQEAGVTISGYKEFEDKVSSFDMGSLPSSTTGVRKYPPLKQVLFGARALVNGWFSPVICSKSKKEAEPNVVMVLALWALVCGKENVIAYYASLESSEGSIENDITLSEVAEWAKEKVALKKEENEKMNKYRTEALKHLYGWHKNPKDTPPPSLEAMTYKLLVFSLCSMKPAQTDYADFNKRRAGPFQGMYNARIKETQLLEVMKDENQAFYPVIAQAYPDLMSQLILSYHTGVKPENVTEGIRYSIEMTSYIGMGTFRQILEFIGSVKETQMITKLHMERDVVNDITNFQAVMDLKLGDGDRDYGTLFLRYGPQLTQSANWPQLAAAGVAYGILQDSTMKRHQLVSKNKSTMKRYLEMLSERAPISGLLASTAPDNVVHALYKIAGDFKISELQFNTLTAEERRSNHALLETD